MPNLAFKPSSYKDIINLPENLVGEIMNGQLETHPRPAPKHALAAGSMGAELITAFQKGSDDSNGWWILPEPECHLDNHVLVPDLAGWQKKRLPILPETAWFELVPDWVCEILSLSTSRIDRIVKMPLYANLKVNYLWLVDHVLRTLETYELHDNHWVLSGSFADDHSISIAPFSEHTFSLSVLWE